MAFGKRNVNGQVTPITLPCIDGSTFNLESMQGKRYIISFFRFASCPFCNLRVHELVKRFEELGENFESLFKAADTYSNSSMVSIATLVHNKTQTFLGGGLPVELDNKL